MENKTYNILGGIFLLVVFIALILTPLHKKSPVVKVAKKLPAFSRRIAVVIDDWGYNLNNLSIVEQIKQPLTCAVLPGLKNSKPVMQKLYSLGFEIILHLPMEPKEKYRLERDTITTVMNAAQIHNILEKDLTSIAFAKGISNHMGSRVTENSRTAALIMTDVKKRNLYFLDSFVTNKSVCSDLAKKIKVRFAKRDVFLDNSDDPAYIKSQVLKLKRIAKNQGVAVGIGHDRKNTLLVLKEMLPQLEADGYKIVFLSEVVR
ncbi:MAG: divergent polysaccharide deacetylase family protein [Candidatus Omnitrophica bacterium]|nr:divergent polysaccharide deacetylase family protein [Candidatus Omnitrophota bacterium]